jgi:hypothetical protein
MGIPGFQSLTFLEPCFRSVRGVDFDMLRIANLLAGVDVDKDDHGTTLYALAFLLVA